MKDSRGVFSDTLGFAKTTWLIGTVIFLHDYFIGEHLFSLVQYSGFVATAVLPFVVREYIKKGVPTNTDRKVYHED